MRIAWMENAGYYHWQNLEFKKGIKMMKCTSCGDKSKMLCKTN